MTRHLPFLLPLFLLALPACLAASPHPMLKHLVQSADVIVVGTFKENRVWYTSELTVLTGSGEAVVERKLAGPDPMPIGTKIEFQIVRVLDLTEEVLERRKAKQKSLQAKKAKTQKEEAPEKPRRSILFLKKGRSDSYHAVDGFLFSLPHDRILEEAVLVEISKASRKQD